ncbi:MAG: SUMF1/EgtB/PvdO family nonheme iron enzyme, partial [Planctomycetota bacterium]
AMEFLEGGSLDHVLEANGPLPPAQAAAMVCDAARGLAAAHAASVVHRDIKPSNLMLSRTGRCKLVDFGLVKIDSVENPFAGDDKGRVLGTPRYVAPEVIEGKGATGAADVYGLCATLYTLLAGAPPYEGVDVAEVYQQHLRAPIPDVRLAAPDCPPGLAEIVTHGLAKRPDDRPSADALAVALQTELAFALAHEDSDAASRSVLDASAGIERSRVRGLPSAWPRSFSWSMAGLVAAGALLSLALRGALSPSSGASSGSSTGGAGTNEVEQRAIETLTNSIGMTLATIPAGSFAMGSPASEPGRHADERLTRVTLSRETRVGVTEVTQAQWRRVMGEGYRPRGGVHPGELRGRRFIGPNLPAYVSWHEASAFCDRLSAMEGVRYRLPTEAEWEHACRAGSTESFAFGAALPRGSANVQVSGDTPVSGGRPLPVGSFAPNAWGLHDLHGNVMEWCADVYEGYPLGAATDPLGVDDGRLRVLRGGAWNADARLARSANRWASHPELRTDTIGFRVVTDPSMELPVATDGLGDETLVVPSPDAEPVGLGEPLIAVDPSLPSYEPEAPLAMHLRAVGSDTMDGLVLHWLRGLGRWHEAMTYRHEARGSGMAVPALAEGLAEFGFVSGPISERELALFQSRHGYAPTLLPIATDAVVVYAHPEHPIVGRGMTLAEIDAVFSSTRRRGHPVSIERWVDLGIAGAMADQPIRLFGRHRASGTRDVFRREVLGGGAYRASMLELVGGTAVLDAIATEPSGIGFGGLGDRSGRVVPIPILVGVGGEGVMPNATAIESSAYPLTRRLWVAIDRAPDAPLTDAQRAFLRYVYSREGQEIVARSGFVPLSRSAIDAVWRGLVPRE